MTKADKLVNEWDPTWSGENILEMARARSEVYSDRQCSKKHLEAFFKHHDIDPLKIRPEDLIEYVMFRIRTSKVKTLAKVLAKKLNLG